MTTPPAIPTVTVRGEARVEVPPDLASLTSTVHATGSTAPHVRGLLAAASRQVADVLDRFPAALESSHTLGLHVAPVFAQRVPHRVTGHAGQLSTLVVVHDFDALSELIGALTTLPHAQLDGPSWSLRPDHPAHRDARRAAVDDAVRRARDYAAAFSAELGDLVELSDVDGGYGGGMPRRYAMAADSADEVVFDLTPETQGVTGQVTARFTLLGVALPADGHVSRP